MLIEIEDRNIIEILCNLENVLEIIEKYSRATNIDYLPEYLTVKDIIDRINKSKGDN